MVFLSSFLPNFVKFPNYFMRFTKIPEKSIVYEIFGFIDIYPYRGIVNSLINLNNNYFMML